jgi:hypothetical protein
MASINMPNRQSKEDPLDKITKAVGLATSIYGVVSENKKLAIAQQQAEATAKLAQENQEMSRETFNMKKAEFDQNQAGIVSQKDFLDKRANFDVVPAGTQGATPLQVQAKGGVQEVYIMPKKKDVDPLVSMMRQQKFEEEKFKKTPQGQYEKLSAETKGKLGALASGMQSLTAFEGQVADQGNLPTTDKTKIPLVGKMFFSQSEVNSLRDKLSDDIGRMRSGGAIGQQEESRFMSMLPTPGDDNPTVFRKLKSLRQEFATKMSAYGFAPERFSEAVPDIKGDTMGLGQVDPEIRDVARRSNKGGVSFAGVGQSPKAPKVIEVEQNGWIYDQNTGKPLRKK